MRRCQTAFYSWRSAVCAARRRAGFHGIQRAMLKGDMAQSFSRKRSHARQFHRVSSRPPISGANGRLTRIPIFNRLWRDEVAFLHTNRAGRSRQLLANAGSPHPLHGAGGSNTVKLCVVMAVESLPRKIDMPTKDYRAALSSRKRAVKTVANGWEVAAITLWTAPSRTFSACAISAMAGDINGLRHLPLRYTSNTSINNKLAFLCLSFR